MKSWNWVVRYAVAIFLALLLGTLLASLPLFNESALGSTHLRASHLAKFLGYGGALLLVWSAGRRATRQLQGERKNIAALRYAIMPLVSLIVLSGSYEVLLQVLAPFLGKTGKYFYNWFFVTCIVAAAAWLTVMWLRHSEPLLDVIRTVGTAAGSDAPSPLPPCVKCGSLASVNATFCATCGERLPVRS